MLLKLFGGLNDNDIQLVDFGSTLSETKGRMDVLLKHFQS